MSVDFLDAFGASDDLFQNGAPLDYYIDPGDKSKGGFRLFCRPWKHKKVQAVFYDGQFRHAGEIAELRKLSQTANDDSEEDGTDSAEILQRTTELSEDLGIETCAHSILCGWETLDGDVPVLGGKPLPFSPENALKVMKLPFGFEMASEVIAFCKGKTQYQEEGKQEAAKN